MAGTIYAKPTGRTDKQINASINATQARKDLMANPIAPVLAPVLPQYPSPAPVGGIAFQPPFNVNNISPQQLAMPTVPTQTAATAGNAFISTQAPRLQALVAGQQEQIQGLQEQDTANQQGLQSIYQQLVQAPQRAEATRMAAGVDEKLSAVNKYTSQIEAEDVAARHAIEKIQKTNALGKSADAIAQEVEQVQRDSLSKKADIAVLQAGAARDYDAASAAADRKIQAETETLKTALDAQKFFYQENKDSLTKKEDQVWQVKLAQGEAELNLITDAKKQAQSLIIEASSYGAPESVVKAAQAAYNQGADAGQIASIVGGYSKAALDRRQAEASIANSYDSIRARHESEAGALPTLNGKPQTQAQALVQGYADRAAQSGSIIDMLGPKFASVSSLGGKLPSFLQGSERQQYEQAKRDFVNSKLRQESGAVISPSEFASAAIQYFPQPGDKPEVIAQKAANRKTALDGLYRQANLDIGAGDVKLEDMLNILNQ